MKVVWGGGIAYCCCRELYSMVYFCHFCARVAQSSLSRHDRIKKKILGSHVGGWLIFLHRTVPIPQMQPVAISMANVRKNTLSYNHFRHFRQRFALLRQQLNPPHSLMHSFGKKGVPLWKHRHKDRYSSCMGAFRNTKILTSLNIISIAIYPPYCNINFWILPLRS